MILYIFIICSLYTNNFMLNYIKLFSKELYLHRYNQEKIQVKDWP